MSHASSFHSFLLLIIQLLHIFWTIKCVPYFLLLFKQLKFLTWNEKPGIIPVGWFSYCGLKQRTELPYLLLGLFWTTRNLFFIHFHSENGKYRPYQYYRPISIFNCNPLPVQSHFSLPFGIFSIWIRILSDKREFVLSFCLCFDFD